MCSPHTCTDWFRWPTALAAAVWQQLDELIMLRSSSRCLTFLAPLSLLADPLVLEYFTFCTGLYIQVANI